MSPLLMYGFTDLSSPDQRPHYQAISYGKFELAYNMLMISLLF